MREITRCSRRCSPAASAALLIAVWRGAPRHPVLTNRIVLYIGLLSYSLYLWHWIVICLSRWTIGISAETLPFQIAAIVGSAAFSYHVVEQPLRRRTWFGSRTLTIGAGLVLLAVSAGVMLAGQKLYLPRFVGSQDSGANTDKGIVTGFVARFSHRNADDCALDRVYSEKADALQANLARCRTGDPADTPMLFIGDSHALDLFPMADIVARDGAFAVTNLYETTCQTPPDTGAAPRCSLGLKYLDGLPRLASGRSIIVVRNNISPKRVEPHFLFYEQSLAGMIRRLTAKGYAVVYVAPSPKYYSVGPGSLCSRQWYRPQWALSSRCRAGLAEPRSEEMVRRRDFMDYLRNGVAKMPRTFVFDPFETLCGSDPVTCSPVSGDRYTYRDDSHLTEFGSELMAPAFEAFLRQKGLWAAKPQPGSAAVARSASGPATPLVETSDKPPGSRYGRPLPQIIARP